MAKTSVSGPAPAAVSPTDNLLTSLWERAGRTDQPILKYPDHGRWASLTWAQLADRVRDVAAGLVDLGVAPGDRVALMSATRVEWTITDLAILAVGGITVPIYETDSPDQCAWILTDAGVQHSIVGTPELAERLERVRSRVDGMGEVLVLDDGALDALAARATDELRAEVERRSKEIVGDDVATYIYTSGTTGNPKGCVITHGNWLWTARQAQLDLQHILGEDDSTLLFLPLAHSFARLIQFLVLEADVPMGYARSIDLLREDLVTFKPTFLLGVPRVFEKVFNGAQRQATGLKRKVFDFAVDTGTAWAKAVDAGQPLSPVLKVRHAIADRLVYSKLRAALGGRIRYVVSGGAPLAPYLNYFFNAAGITILEGYGLTETCAPATVNKPHKRRIGTVGLPLAGVEIKVADDGELLIRGGSVFQGYHGNPEATREVIDDEGWFHTGDIGEIDDDGFVRITGRKKELIVTAGGKNVAPAVLEERMKAHRLISQAMVIGDNRPFISALVTLDEEELAAFAEEKGLSGRTAAELKDDPVVAAEVAAAVAHANEAVSRAESIRKWTVLDRDFSLDDREMTPTMKLRRMAISDNFAEDIEALYES